MGFNLRLISTPALCLVVALMAGFEAKAAASAETFEIMLMLYSERIHVIEGGLGLLRSDPEQLTEAHLPFESKTEVAAIFVRLYNLSADIRFKWSAKSAFDRLYSRIEVMAAGGSQFDRKFVSDVVALVHAGSIEPFDVLRTRLAADWGEANGSAQTAGLRAKELRAEQNCEQLFR